MCPTPQAAFAHLALAFRCDVFTLRQRVQVEKRARDAAEENIQEELGQCRAALEVGGQQGRGLASAGDVQQGFGQLEVLSAAAPSSCPQWLGPSCTSAGCKETLEQLQRSLAVLAAAVERATSAAEKLGAVHQV